MSTYVRRQKRDFIGILVLSAWIAGCPKRAPIDPDLPQSPVPQTVGPLPSPTRPDGSEQVTTYDLDQDGRIEVWVYAAAADASRIVRKELDLNADGQADLRKEYDAAGVLTLESYDADFDGQPDSISHYREGRLETSERDEDGDSRRETRVVYGADEEIVRVELDRNGDGRVDYREEWEKGAVARRFVDQAGDGTLSPVTD